MADKPQKPIQVFEWSLLPDFSQLLNRLGRHGVRSWPESPDELRSELETLRIDPDRDIGLAFSDSELCGYALTLVESDIDRLVASIATTADCSDLAQLLMDFTLERGFASGVSAVHTAVRGSAVEPVETLKQNGFRPVTANIELSLERSRSAGIRDVPLPEGFSVRSMRSSAETLLLTQVQNTVFEQHWGFSRNTPEEIQARLDLPVSGPEHVLFAESPEGDIAGYVWTALEWDGSHTCGKIWMTGIMPEFRSQGLGRAVVTAGIKHLFANGAADIHLEVMEDNTAAVQIYTGMGFEQSGKTEWYEKQL